MRHFLFRTAPPYRPTVPPHNMAHRTAPPYFVMSFNFFKTFLRAPPYGPTIFVPRYCPTLQPHRTFSRFHFFLNIFASPTGKKMRIVKKYGGVEVWGSIVEWKLWSRTVGLAIFLKHFENHENVRWGSSVGLVSWNTNRGAVRWDVRWAVLWGGTVGRYCGEVRNRKCLYGQIATKKSFSL